MDREQDIILIDKPKGITSFDVIRTLRRELNMKKMGHAGTLDPNASGLLIVGVGRGTKRLAEFLKLDKTYEAEIILGERRTTGDIEGEILETSDASAVSEEAIKNSLEGMVGELTLPVPIYSALKRGGEPLYKKARRGEDVEPAVRTMHIAKAELVRVERHPERTHVIVVFDVGSGTYIRSLAEELGRRLGVPATLGNLRRTRIGEFSLEDARPLAR